MKITKKLRHFNPDGGKRKTYKKIQILFVKKPKNKVQFRGLMVTP